MMKHIKNGPSMIKPVTNYMNKHVIQEQMYIFITTLVAPKYRTHFNVR